MFSFEQRGIPAKTWIVLEEGECCQDHRMPSRKIRGQILWLEKVGAMPLTSAEL